MTRPFEPVQPHRVALCLALLVGCTPALVGTKKPDTVVSPLFDARAYEKIAVIVTDRSGAVGRNAILRPVEDEFFHELLAKGYSVASRSDLDKVLREQQLQLSTLTEQGIACVGRILNARAVLITSLNDVTPGSMVTFVSSNGKTIFTTIDFRIGARMLDIERAQILWTSNYEGSYYTGNMDRDEVAVAALPRIARVVAADIPAPKDSDNPPSSLLDGQSRSGAPARKRLMPECPGQTISPGGSDAKGKATPKKNSKKPKKSKKATVPD